MYWTREKAPMLIQRPEPLRGPKARPCFHNWPLHKSSDAQESGAQSHARAMPRACVFHKLNGSRDRRHGRSEGLNPSKGHRSEHKTSTEGEVRGGGQLVTKNDFPLSNTVSEFQIQSTGTQYSTERRIVIISTGEGKQHQPLDHIHWRNENGIQVSSPTAMTQREGFLF